MDNGDKLVIERLREQRDDALNALLLVITSYKKNQRRGIGIGPLIRARKVLERHGMGDIYEEDKS